MAKAKKKSEVKDLNYKPTSLELTNLDQRVEKFKLALGIMNEMIYVEIVREDDNVSHAKFEVKLKENNFIEGIAFMKPEFQKFVEKFFKGYAVQANNNRTIFNIWFYKK